MKSTALFAFFISACGSLPREPSPDYVWNSNLKVYLLEFMEHLNVPEEALVNLLELDYRTVPDPARPKAIGVCDAPSYVYIDPVLSEAAQHFVTIHELGHCLLELDHNDNTTIMNTYVDPDMAPLTDEKLELYYSELKAMQR